MSVKILQKFCKEFQKHDIDNKFEVLKNYKRIVQELEKEGLVQI